MILKEKEEEIVPMGTGFLQNILATSAFYISHHTVQ